MRFAIAAALTAYLMCPLTHAQIAVSAPPMPGSEEVTCTNMELEKRVPCPDNAMRFPEGRSLVERAYHARDFSKLDSLYKQWCTGQDRFPDGLWKLSEYTTALSGLFSIWDAWGKDLQKLKAWQQANPNSSAAILAEAEYWWAYAWKARGTGYANTVSKEGWELYRERLNRSKEALSRLNASDLNCPAPYATMISVNFLLGMKEPALREIFSEAVRKFPQYHQIYFSMARTYEPKWGGSIEKYEQFANEAAERTKAFEGMGMYSRVYWLVDYNSGIPFRPETSRTPVWNKLKAGYEDLIRLYPSSLHNLGKYAGVACRTPDSKLYGNLRDKIDGYENSADMLDPVDVCDRRHKWQPKGN